jgi:hypothetical protein
MTVGMLREQLGLDAENEGAGRADVIAFITWCAIALVYHVVAIAVGLALVWVAWLSLRR